jgi:hypothetical protein
MVKRRDAAFGAFWTLFLKRADLDQVEENDSSRQVREGRKGRKSFDFASFAALA